VICKPSQIIAFHVKETRYTGFKTVQDGTRSRFAPDAAALAVFRPVAGLDPTPRSTMDRPLPGWLPATPSDRVPGPWRAAGAIGEDNRDQVVEQPGAPPVLTKVISGGQTGADQAGWRAARALVRLLLILIAAWGVLSTSVIAIFVLSTEENPDNQAILKMGIALMLIWCVLGGTVMYLLRDRFVAWATRIPLAWRTRFVLLCIAFAMLEEAVTTSLTNLAPFLGGVTDAARITASKNYLEVVFLHSVIAFVPIFVCWAWLLGRYDFRPVEALLLFGLNGTLAETLAFGPQNLLQVGMWTFVYGLMVYLPACTVPEERGAKPTRWWHWPLAVFLPLVFVVPLALWLVARAVMLPWNLIRGRRVE
jgi:hypothetical protein